MRSVVDRNVVMRRIPVLVFQITNEVSLWEQWPPLGSFFCERFGAHVPTEEQKVFGDIYE